MLVNLTKWLWSLVVRLVWDWGTVEEDLGPMPDLAATLESLAGTLRDIARFTKTTVDDRIVRALQLALSTPAVMDVIKRLFANPLVSTREDGDRDAAIKGLATAHEPELRPLVEAAGLTWDDFLAMLLAIMRYALGLDGRRAWKLPWA